MLQGNYSQSFDEEIIIYIECFTSHIHNFYTYKQDISTWVELQAGRSAVLIESSDVGYEGALIQASGLSLQKNFDQMLERLQSFCESK